MFEFSVHVRVSGSRHVARRIAEAVLEVLEGASYPPDYGRPSALYMALERAQGLSCEVTGVTKIKEVDSEQS